MYSSKIICCKDCKERYIGCHSKCEKYITEKRNLEESKKLYYKSLPPKIGEGDFLGDDGHMRLGKFKNLKRSQRTRK